MSYIGDVRRTAFSSLGTAASTVLVGAFHVTFGVAKALYNRRTLSQLGQFDDRMLKDIGLSRSDLRDASAGPIWQDPTTVLVVRAVERRASRREAARADQRFAAGAPEVAKANSGLVANSELVDCR